MSPRGRLISRVAVFALVGCLFAIATPLPGSAASHSPGATSAKKCKRKHHKRKRRCRRRAVPAPAPASIVISPPNQDFGGIGVGGTTRAFTVGNAGGTPSGIPVPSIAGQDASSFSIVATTCMAALLPGGSCQVDVHLDFVEPVGVHSGTLIITAAPGGTATAAMAGDVEV